MGGKGFKMTKNGQQLHGILDLIAGDFTASWTDHLWVVAPAHLPPKPQPLHTPRPQTVNRAGELHSLYSSPPSFPRRTPTISTAPRNSSIPSGA